MVKEYKARLILYLLHFFVCMIIISSVFLLNDLYYTVVEAICLVILVISLINKLFFKFILYDDKLVIKTLLKTNEFYFKDIKCIVKNPKSKGNYVSYGLYTYDNRWDAITIWIQHYKEILKYTVEHTKLFNTNSSIDIKVINDLRNM